MAEKISERRKVIQGMDDAKLKEELTKLKKEQFNLRFQQATGTLEKAATHPCGSPRHCSHQDNLG